jgi:hypothetical protein
MLLSKKLWAVLLVAVLVAGLLVGFGDGDEAVAKEPRATLGKIMVPAAAFIPASDDSDYINGGEALGLNSGTGFFTAPLWFPAPVVNIRKITLIAYDNSVAGKVCVTLSRAQPLTADDSDAGQVCTTDSTDIPQRIAMTALSPRRMNSVNHGPYLLAGIATTTALFGVQVVYTY